MFKAGPILARQILQWARSMPEPRTVLHFQSRPASTAVGATSSSSLREILKEGSHFDAIVIGAGIGGAAAALGATTPQLAAPLSKFEIDPHGRALRNLNVDRPRRVLVLEAESDFCFHSTGRSAAIFSEVYGSPSTQALSTATKPFMYAPRQMGLEPSNGGHLVTRRPNLWVATEECHAEMLALFEHSRRLIPSLRLLTPEQIGQLVPWAMKNNDAPPAPALLTEFAENRADFEAAGIFPPAPLTGALLEPEAADMDVDAIWRTIVHRATQNGASLHKGVRIGAVSRGAPGSHQTGWEIELSQGGGGDVTRSCEPATGSHSGSVRVFADVVINAGGAWADDVAAKFGFARTGLIPKRRTVILFDPREVHADFSYPRTAGSFAPGALDEAAYLQAQTAWPAVFCLNGRYYYKPDAGRVLASPEDEIDSAPVDAQPEEEQVGLCVNRLQTFSYLQPQRVSGKWAGLRSFVADGNFVIGKDANDAQRPTSKAFAASQAGDFVWLAALGGFGIQTSLGNARLIAGLLHQGAVPQDMQDNGLQGGTLSPARFKRED